MKLGEQFPSSYLKKEDLPKKGDTVLTIKEAVVETVGQGEDQEERPVLHFEEDDRGLVLNKTNVSRIIAAHSTDDSNELVGKKIALYVDHEVSFRGKTVGAIRIRATAPEEEAPF